MGVKGYTPSGVMCSSLRVVTYERGAVRVTVERGRRVRYVVESGGGRLELDREAMEELSRLADYSLKRTMFG